MALIPLIHMLIIVIEDIFVWLGGSMGISAWLVIGVSLVIFYFFYNKIFAFFKAIFVNKKALVIFIIALFIFLVFGVKGTSAERPNIIISINNLSKYQNDLGWVNTSSGGGNTTAEIQAVETDPNWAGNQSNYVISSFIDANILSNATGGGATSSKWIDKGNYIEPNSSLADNVNINGYLNVSDWSNVSITEIQISDLTHTFDTWFGNQTNYVNWTVLLNQDYFNFSTWNNIWNATYNSTDEIFGAIDNSSFLKVGEGDGATNDTYSTHTNVNDNTTRIDTNIDNNVTAWASITNNSYALHTNVNDNFSASGGNTTDEIFGAVDNSSFLKVGEGDGSTNSSYALHTNVNSNISFDTWFGNQTNYVNWTVLLNQDYYNSTLINTTEFQDIGGVLNLIVNNIFGIIDNSSFLKVGEGDGSTNSSYALHTNVNDNITRIDTNIDNNVTVWSSITNATHVSLTENNTGLLNISGNILTEGDIKINQSSALCLNDACTSNITNNGTHSIWN